MRISSVASVSLTILLLTACGTNQTEQMSQSVEIQNGAQVAVEKQEPISGTAEMAASGSEAVKEGVEEQKIEDLKTDITAESTSDNSMIKETGITGEGTQVVGEQSMEASEGDKKEIAKQKESENPVVEEPKS